VSAAKKRIFIVEDEIILAMATKLVLEREGYLADFALNGEEAVEKVLHGSDDVAMVLMDIDLGGGMDGVETAKEILGRKDLPLVFLSAHMEREVIRMTESVTSYGYIVKGVGEREMLASVAMAFKLFNANLELKRKEEQYRRIIESAMEGILVIDEGGVIGLMNGRMADMLGCPRDGTECRKISDFTFDEDLPVYMERIRMERRNPG